MPKVHVLCPTCNRYYDSSNDNCPYCDDSSGGDDKKICPNCGRSYDSSNDDCPYCIPPTEPVYEEDDNYYDEEEDTTIILKSGNVVGWLVCTEGADKGRDFRLHAENNFAGRGSEYDINLCDKKVSRQGQFSVFYDDEDDIYYLMKMGGGKGIVRFNGKPADGNNILNKGDKIRVGDTTLIFIPLEKCDMQWN